MSGAHRSIRGRRGRWVNRCGKCVGKSEKSEEDKLGGGEGRLRSGQIKGNAHSKATSRLSGPFNGETRADLIPGDLGALTVSERKGHPTTLKMPRGNQGRGIEASLQRTVFAHWQGSLQKNVRLDSLKVLKEEGRFRGIKGLLSWRAETEIWEAGKVDYLQDWNNLNFRLRDLGKKTIWGIALKKRRELAIPKKGPTPMEKGNRKRVNEKARREASRLWALSRKDSRPLRGKSFRSESQDKDKDERGGKELFRKVSKSGCNVITEKRHEKGLSRSKVPEMGHTCWRLPQRVRNSGEITWKSEFQSEKPQKKETQRGYALLRQRSQQSFTSGIQRGST